MNRRNFVAVSGASALSLTDFRAVINANEKCEYSQIDNLNIIGPKTGYSPQLGTLVSMMNWMRNVVLRSVRGMSISDLDFILDENSNSIGAMLWHLAATERYYQINTLKGKRWEGLSSDDSRKWQAASNLGEQGRLQIKGYSLDFYLELLNDVRDFTLEEFKNLDDDWLMEVDYNFWGSGTNNYCKWFHVCEHESNHNGQIKFINKRILT